MPKSKKGLNIFLCDMAKVIEQTDLSYDVAVII